MWRFWKFICLKIRFFIVFLFVVQCVVAQKIDKSALELIVKVDSNLRASNSVHFKAEIYARMKDGEYNQKAEFKIQRNPLKIYYKQFLGNNIELLYDQTLDKDRALINPDGFPYANLKLSPYSSVILKRQHHSIFEADPLYSIDQLFYMFEQCSPDKCFISLSDTIVKGKIYKLLKYSNPYYKILQQKVGFEMSIIDFARKHHINYYSLVCLNDDFDSSTILEKGEVVKIPSSYAKSIEILIDIQKLQVYAMDVYDQKGLFEKMEYIWFKNNAVFEDIDFEKDNKNYNF